MTKANEKDGSPDKAGHSHHRVRLPGFIADEEIGPDYAVKRATSYFGIQPCRGCARRAAALDRWLVFINRRSK